MLKTYNEWEEFAKTREKVSIYLTPQQIFYATPLEKTKTHREIVNTMFKDKGVEVYRFAHNYDATTDQDYWGLVFHRTDSDLVERTEITALIGVNARYIASVEGSTP